MTGQDELIQTLQAEAGALRLSLQEIRDWLREIDPHKRLAVVERVLSGDAGRRGYRDLELSKNTLRRILEWAGEIKDDDPEELDPYKAHKAAVVICKLAGSTLEALQAGRYEASDREPATQA